MEIHKVKSECLRRWQKWNRRKIKRIKGYPSSQPAFSIAHCPLSPPYLCAMKILVVCLGNICRSPLAEGILQKKIAERGLDWQVESAGTNGYHIGEAPHRLSQKVAKSNGLDISKQVSRRFVPRDFAGYDRIYVMANDVMDELKEIAGKKYDQQKVDYFLNALHPGKNHDVPDPWYGDEDGYIDVYKLIDEACDAIIENILQENKNNN